ncbi:MAG: hypothetical protein ACE5DS_09355, partial [Kiloniellaceae bacterium]
RGAESHRASGGQLRDHPPGLEEEETRRVGLRSSGRPVISARDIEPRPAAAEELEALQTIGRYAEKYILIEFMPQGLTDGIVFPEFPDWYNVAWFRDAFLKKFELIEERQLESNRILFVGKKFRPVDSSLSSQHSARPVALQGTPASGA